MKVNIHPLKPAHRRKASFFPALVAAALAIVHAVPSEADTAYGSYALFNNQGPNNYNSAFGEYALVSNIYGGYNTANGTEALYSNIEGYNTANGAFALRSNTTGHDNTANGAYALYSNTTGNFNTTNGYYALYKNTTGTGNTAAGRSALAANTRGKFNTAIGYAANVAAGNLSNATAIGYKAIVDASNKVRIGNAAITVIEGQVPWTSTSDKRLKNHIADLPLGLDFIGKLRPVEYIRNNNSEQTREWGLIAQELQQTLSDVGYKNAGIVTEDASPEKYLALRYNDLLAPMIKAIQEQNKTIEEQNKAIQDQHKTIAVLLKRIEALEKK